jgi:hypothetical protein
MDINDPALVFDLRKALDQWEKADFYETLEAELQSGVNASIFRDCLRLICPEEATVERVSDVITHSAYDIAGEIWAIVRMDILTSMPVAGSAERRPEKQRGLLSLSINRTTAKGAVTSLSRGEEE